MSLESGEHHSEGPERGALVRLSNDVDRAALDGLSHAEWHVLDTFLGRLIRTLEWDKALIE